MSATQTIRILLADDHKIVREGLRRLLETESDMQVVEEAADGRDAVEACKRVRPDVVVMDLAMPNLNGVEATRQITDGRFAPKVLCLSMHREQKMITAMLRAGASGYLLKNCAARDMAQAIRTVAGGETFLSSAIAGEVIDHFVRGEPGDESSAFTKLSDREREVLQLIAEGLSTKEAAARLDISQKTVLAHRRNIMEKLDIHSNAELTRYALREGLTEL
jgi:DNA-binding NarL/FixJ family response regulator